MHSSKGFSLLEVVIVMVIITILVTFAVPDLMGWSARAQLKKATRDVYATLQRARIGALKNGVPWEVNFDLNKQFFQLRDPGKDMVLRTKDDVTTITDFKEYNGVTVKKVTFPRKRATFKSGGTLVQGGTVSLENNEGDKFDVIALFTTGRIRIKEK